MTVEKTLQEKGYDYDETQSIIYEELDDKVREKFGVANHDVHLWQNYELGDANENELLKDCGYDNVNQLFIDMNNYLSELAINY